MLAAAVLGIELLEFQCEGRVRSERGTSVFSPSDSNNSLGRLRKRVTIPVRFGSLWVVCRTSDFLDPKLHILRHQPLSSSEKDIFCHSLSGSFVNTSLLRHRYRRFTLLCSVCLPAFLRCASLHPPPARLSPFYLPTMLVNFKTRRASVIGSSDLRRTCPKTTQSRFLEST